MFLSNKPPLDPGHGPADIPGFALPDTDVSLISRKWLDVAYANKSDSQKLDIFLPETGEGPFPVILHIHGGGFEFGDKRDGHLAPYLLGLQRGYAILTTNYRLSAEATFPAAVEDLKAAVRWIKTNGEHYLLDGNRLAPCGGSAGGNLAAMLCLTSDVKEFDDPSLCDTNVSCDVKAGVDMFGPTDFLLMDSQQIENNAPKFDHDQAKSPESKYLGAPIQSVPEIAARANPITYIHKNMPPMLIQHGKKDILVPLQQSLLFINALEEQGLRDRFEFDILSEAGHGDPQFETEENMNRVFNFLDQYLK
jgi:Esterase/lipase